MLRINHFIVTGIGIVCIAVLISSAAFARPTTIIRDYETEQFLRELSAPVFEAAGFSPDDIALIIVGDDRVNAYVAGGKNIFIHSGLIEETETIDELVGVIAHEMGHIAAGHLARSHEVMSDAAYQTILSTILGVAVAVGSGNPSAGIGVAMGGSEVTKRQILKNSRIFESSADQAAIRFLHHSGHSADGLASFLEKLSRQELLPESQQMEYLLTHPLSRDRVEAVQAAIKGKEKSQWPVFMHQQYERIKAKISGYLHPERTSKRTLFDKSTPGEAPPLSIPQTYGQSIAAYRMGDIPLALDLLDRLINKEPKNPYFHELKGQILFESSQIVPALMSYKTSLEYVEGPAGLIHMAYGHALLESRNDSVLDEALESLLTALRTEKRSPSLHRMLSIAYGRLGEKGLAKLHLAEEGFLLRDLAFTIQQATMAIDMLEDGSSAQQRAKDLLRLAEEKKI